MEQLEAPLCCGHCGNIGNCQVKASYTYDISRGEIFNGESGDYHENNEQRIWFLFQCTACSRPILAECIIKEEKELGEIPEVFKLGMLFGGNEGNLVLPTLFNQFSPYNNILYPQDKSINQWMLPDGVSQAYNSALRVQKIDAGAFAVMVGRTLEKICHCENAQGKVLIDKIKSLAISGRIPQVLADMFTQLRLLRNFSAHANENDYVVKEEDIPIIREFIDAILEYLYIAPLKINHLQRRIDGELEDFEIFMPGF